jgi:large subunit ribosomal protein L29
MYAKDVRKMTDDDILNAIEDQKIAMFNLRFQQASGQLEDLNSIKRSRREVARLKTILRERHLAAQRVSEEQKKNAQ